MNFGIKTKYRKYHDFYLLKTRNKLHRCKVYEILIGIHILHFKFGVKMNVLCAFEKQGPFCNDFKSLKDFQGRDCDFHARSGSGIPDPRAVPQPGSLTCGPKPAWRWCGAGVARACADAASGVNDMWARPARLQIRAFYRVRSG